LALCIGVDVGGSHITSALFDSNNIVARHDTDFMPSAGMDLAQTVKDCVMAVCEGTSPLPPVGVGVPGVVAGDGLVKLAPNLGVQDYPLEAALRELGIHAKVINDANAAAIAEWWSGAGKGKDNLICLTIGTGIGGGVISRGRLLVGAGGRTGELGHVVVDPRGAVCSCGARGCLETLASGSAMARRALIEAEHDPFLRDLMSRGTAPRGAEVVFAAARAGSVTAQRIIDDAASWLAVGLENVVAILDPEIIVLGGGVAMAGEQYLGAVRAALSRYPVYMLDATPVVQAAHGRDAGVIGAAAYALNESEHTGRFTS
jgi:glucokinase